MIYLSWLLLVEAMVFTLAKIVAVIQEEVMVTIIAFIMGELIIFLISASKSLASLPWLIRFSNNCENSTSTIVLSVQLSESISLSRDE